MTEDSSRDNRRKVIGWQIGDVVYQQCKSLLLLNSIRENEYQASIVIVLNHYAFTLLMYYSNNF